MVHQDGPEIVVVLDNLRSALNVGSIMRTCDGFGVKKLITTGTTPHVKVKNDNRLPHIIKYTTAKISKSALGAEKAIGFEHYPVLTQAIKYLQDRNYKIIAIEQSTKSKNLEEFPSYSKIALIFGNEVTGLNEKFLKEIDGIYEIKMHGKKESFNVSIAVGIALYHIRRT